MDLKRRNKVSHFANCNDGYGFDGVEGPASTAFK
jgi:hypothetical protein